MKLQVDSGDSVRSVLVAAKISNVEIEVAKAEGKKDALLPLLVTPHGSIFGANAIARYVVRSSGDAGHLLGKSNLEAAQVESWLTFALAEIESPLNGWVAGNKAASGDVRKALSCLDGVLRSRTFLVGERLTLADVVLANTLLPGFQSVIDAKTRKPFKNIVRWFKTVVNHPAVASVLGNVTLSGDKAPCNAGAAVAAVAAPAKKEAADDDDFDCFGDDDEDDTARQEEIQRIADEAKKAKEAKGKVLVEKSVVVIDVKPYDSETDLRELEAKIRTIEMEGLEWKTAELKEIAFGLNKLVIMCHIVDKLISVDDLQEKIQEFEDEVQSTDIATFTKL